MKYLLPFLIYPSLFYCQASANKIELAKSISIKWEITTFKEKEHAIGICKSDAWNYICTIDRKPWYGSDQDMKMPRNQLVKLWLDIHGKHIQLETSCMFNPSYDGNLVLNRFKLVEEGVGYRLFAFFSDGAGTYMAEWKIIDGTSVRELISNDEKYFGWQD